MNYEINVIFSAMHLLCDVGYCQNDFCAFTHHLNSNLWLALSHTFPYICSQVGKLTGLVFP